MLEPIKIVEKKIIPSDTTMLIGLPDVGLVGLIATSYLISELNLEEIAYMDSDLLPPVVVLHNGLPHSPLRIYGNQKLIAVISELAIPAPALYNIMRKIIDWGEEKKVKSIISMGGIPLENRQTINEPEVFGAASDQKLLEILNKKGLNTMKEGYIVGAQALSMRYSLSKNIPAIAILSQSFYNYPDPQAAAITLKELSKISDIEVDVSKLLEKGEEIRLKARDIMKRTQQEMNKMQKSQEYDLPLYV
ncbi:proteasome assembly chaperone family protein [Candidatus Bathyarchaeota archaeon]|nr:proteasome assembly chaperone family protein [Candidatus Bathyarchaeota archaeon]